MDRSNIILVVDDDSAILELIVEVLEDEGYRVCATTNSQEVLELVCRERPTLILLDLHMPYMNGLEVIDQLYDGGFADLPVVLITASSEASIDMAHLDGRPYLLKPFDIGELVACVARYTPPSQQQIAPQPPDEPTPQHSNGAANGKMLLAPNPPARLPESAGGSRYRYISRSRPQSRTTYRLPHWLRAWRLMSPSRRRIRQPLRTSPGRPAAVFHLAAQPQADPMVPAVQSATTARRLALHAQTASLVAGLAEQYDRAIVACQQAAQLLEVNAKTRQRAKATRAQVAQSLHRAAQSRSVIGN